MEAIRRVVPLTFGEYIMYPYLPAVREQFDTIAGAKSIRLDTQWLIW